MLQPNPTGHPTEQLLCYSYLHTFIWSCVMRAIACYAPPQQASHLGITEQCGIAKLHQQQLQLAGLTPGSVAGHDWRFPTPAPSSAGVWQSLCSAAAHSSHAGVWQSPCSEPPRRRRRTAGVWREAASWGVIPHEGGTLENYTLPGAYETTGHHKTPTSVIVMGVSSPCAAPSCRDSQSWGPHGLIP